jgi:uncharacterized membrane protein
MIGNIIILVAIAVGWYFAYSRMDAGQGEKNLRMFVLIALALVFLIVLLSTLGVWTDLHRGS